MKKKKLINADFYETGKLGKFRFNQKIPVNPDNLSNLLKEIKSQCSGVLKKAANKHSEMSYELCRKVVITLKIEIND